MLLLDTNAISEIMRGPEVRDASFNSWLAHLDRRPATTAISAMETLVGIAVVPPGKRREELSDRARRALTRLQPIVPFDAEAAAAYAKVVADRTLQGRPISMPDAQIAAIAIIHGAALVTRNTKDFSGLGIELINPWE